MKATKTMTMKHYKILKRIGIIVFSIGILLSLLLVIDARILTLFGLRVKTSN